MTIGQRIACFKFRASVEHETVMLHIHVPRILLHNMMMSDWCVEKLFNMLLQREWFLRLRKELDGNALAVYQVLVEIVLDHMLWHLSFERLIHDIILQTGLAKDWKRHFRKRFRHKSLNFFVALQFLMKVLQRKGQNRKAS
jgi:hypothetical protein